MLKPFVVAPIAGSIASIDAGPAKRAVSSVEAAMWILRRRAELEEYCARAWRGHERLYREWDRLDAELSASREAERVVRIAQAARARAIANLSAAVKRVAEARLFYAYLSPWRETVASLRNEALLLGDKCSARIASAIHGVGLKVAHMIEVTERQFEMFRRHVHQFIIFGDERTEVLE